MTGFCLDGKRKKEKTYCTKWCTERFRSHPEVSCDGAVIYGGWPCPYEEYRSLYNLSTDSSALFAGPFK
jgi:hypothetical protein